MKKGTLYLVGTPIGNLEDITLRALRILGQVPVIAAEDTRSAKNLLSRHGLYPREVQILSYFAGNEAKRGEEILEILEGGQDVALISEAGSPGISDPGSRLVSTITQSQKADIRIEVLPGPCAPIAALSASGLPTDRFVFVGFPPRAEGERQALFGSLRTEPSTLILLESKERTGRTLSELYQALGDRPACLCRELTKVYEEYVRAPLSELCQRYENETIKGEITLVVGGGKTALSETQPAYSDADIEEEIAARIEQGQGAKEIAAAISLKTGRSRRHVYQLVVAKQEHLPASKQGAG